MILKPDWSTAPDWANFWAMDHNGFACWFEGEPRWNGECGEWSGGKQYARDLSCIIERDAGNTLTKRPDGALRINKKPCGGIGSIDGWMDG